MQKKPPVCPACEEPLQSVIWEVDSDRYEWNGNSYTLTREGGGTTRCPNCEADVSNLFPEGPVNYTENLDGNCGKKFDEPVQGCSGEPKNGKWPEKCLTCKRFVP